MYNNLNTILNCKDLNIEFITPRGVKKIVRGIDLELYKGKITAIIGESGSGKTITARSIAGILPKNSRVSKGEIIYTNKENEKINLLELTKEELRNRINGKKISMIFQNAMNALDPTAKIGKQIIDYLKFNLNISKEQAEKKAITLLELVGIKKPEECLKAYPHQMSGGMCQRIVIAIALSCSPEILICDEPTTALDIINQSKILKLIKKMQKEFDLSVLLITHDIRVVSNIADYVNIMYAGKIVEKGTIDEILFDARHPYTWGLLSAIPDYDCSDEKLYTIKGNPTPLDEEIRGDAFATRNPYALNIDKRISPPFFKITDTHYAATWLLDKRAPKVEIPEKLKNKIKKIKRETIK